MSFSRAVIKRFNETTDNGIPPPGAYDPKFETDVGVIAAKNGSGSEKLVRQNVGSYGKSRSEDTEPSSQHHPLRVNRDSSFARRTNAADAGKRDPFVAKKTSGTLRSRTDSRTSNSSAGKYAANNNNITRKTPTASSSSSSCASRKNKNPEVNDKKNESDHDEITDQRKSSNRSIVSSEGECCESGGASCQAVIEEIQMMAQNLQVEVSEYKRRLATEVIRSKEFEAKKLELEFTVKSLMREVEKHDTAKQTWQENDSLHQSKIEELNVKAADLEQQIEDLQARIVELKENEEKLLEKIAKLQEDKVSMQNEKLKLEMTLEELQGLLGREERKRLDAEEKCKELAAQMESCYHTCENRTSEIENMREVFEVKVQELTQQKEDLHRELDSVRRELETQKTLMELAKSEEEADTEKGKQDDYIS